MRWLLLKDLQVLRRSPLQAVLLIAYPIAVAVLIGFAISRGPEKPRVAFLDQIPTGARISVGGARLAAVGVGERICGRLDCIDVSSRRQAIAKVQSGDVLAALVLPANLVERLNSLSTLNPETPRVEVIVNEEDPVKAGLVNDRISSLLAQANLLVARRIATEGGRFLNLIINGGTFSVVGEPIDILGLRASASILRALRPAVPRGQLRGSLDRVIHFATLSGENLNVATPLIRRLAQPIVVNRRVVSAPAPPLEIFAVAVAATFTLTFVTVLLVAGSLALEREESTFSRLTRGLVSRSALVGGKVILGTVVGLTVTILMLAGIELFVPLDWGRFGLWLAAIVLGAAALAAAGAALAALAREVRAVALLAFMISLPIALLSLVPSGAVGPTLFDWIRVVTALFPFKPALQAITAALDASGAGIGLPLLHLAVLTLAYGVIARFGLRRFAAV